MVRFGAFISFPAMLGLAFVAKRICMDFIRRKVVGQQRTFSSVVFVFFGEQ